MIYDMSKPGVGTRDLPVEEVEMWRALRHAFDHLACPLRQELARDPVVAAGATIEAVLVPTAVSRVSSRHPSSSVTMQVRADQKIGEIPVKSPVVIRILRYTVTVT